jgi:molecular chaperone IbpA
VKKRTRDELDIQVEKGVLTVCGSKQAKDERKYPYQGIANRTFERKFNLADYIEVTGADLSNGLLTISKAEKTNTVPPMVVCTLTAVSL